MIIINLNSWNSSIGNFEDKLKFIFEKIQNSSTPPTFYIPEVISFS